MANAFDPEPFLKSLPQQPGVYRMLGGEGEVLYVGKARSLKARVTSYFRASGLTTKTMALVAKIHDVQITVTNSETEALLLEQSLIKEERPPYNIVLRDDKSYPFIHLTDHPYPRLSFHRGAKNRKGRYFGLIRARARYVKASTYCRSCLAFGRAKTGSTRIVRGLACNTRSNVVAVRVSAISIVSSTPTTCASR